MNLFGKSISIWEVLFYLILAWAFVIGPTYVLVNFFIEKSNPKPEVKDTVVLTAEEEMCVKEIRNRASYAQFSQDMFEYMTLSNGIDSEAWFSEARFCYKFTYDSGLFMSDEDIDSAIIVVWNTPYFDTMSGYEHTFKEWTYILRDSASVRKYFDHVFKIYKYML